MPPTSINPYIHKQVKVNVQSILGISPDNIINFDARMEQLSGNFTLTIPQTDRLGNPVIIPYNINDFVPSITTINGINFQGFVDDISDSTGSQGLLYRIDGSLIPQGARDYRPKGYWSGDPFHILGLTLDESRRHPININFKPFDNQFKGVLIHEESGLTFSRLVQLICQDHNIQLDLVPGYIDYKVFKYYYSGENLLGALEELAQHACANCILTPTSGDMILRILPWGSNAVPGLTAYREDSLAEMSVTKDKPNYNYLQIEPSKEMTPFNSGYFGPLEKVFDVSIALGPTGMKDLEQGQSWSVPKDQVYFPLDNNPPGDVTVQHTINFEKNQSIENEIHKATENETAVWDIKILEKIDNYSGAVPSFTYKLLFVKQFASVMYHAPFSGKDLSQILYIVREKDREVINVKDPDYETYTDPVTLRLKESSYENLTSDRDVKDITKLYVPDILEPKGNTPLSRAGFQIEASGVFDLPEDYLTAIPENARVIKVTPVDYLGDYKIRFVFGGNSPYYTRKEVTMGIVETHKTVFYRNAAMGTAEFKKGSDLVKLTSPIDFDNPDPGSNGRPIPKFKSFVEYLWGHVTTMLPWNAVRATGGITVPNVIDRSYVNESHIHKWSEPKRLAEIERTTNTSINENYAVETRRISPYGLHPDPEKKAKGQYHPNIAYLELGVSSAIDYTGPYSFGAEIKQFIYGVSPYIIPGLPGLEKRFDSGVPSRNIIPITAEYSFYAFPRRLISGTYTLQVGTAVGHMTWEYSPFSTTRTLSVFDPSTQPNFNPKKIQSDLFVDYTFTGNNPPLSKHLYNFAAILSNYMNTTYFKYTYQTYLDSLKPFPTLGGIIDVEGTKQSNIISVDVSIGSQGAILNIGAGRFPIP